MNNSQQQLFASLQISFDPYDVKIEGKKLETLLAYLAYETEMLKTPSNHFATLEKVVTPEPAATPKAKLELVPKKRELDWKQRASGERDDDY